MATVIVGLVIGALFGAALVLAALADPDKIIGTLRLKDFHAMRTIAVFVLVGMLGTWILGLVGLANLSIKPTTLVTVLIGGSLLGIGFGLTGFCPGTGLACAASGRIDALVTVIGMFAGALAYIFIHPSVAAPLEKIADYGKVTLPQMTNTPAAAWVIPLFAVGTLVLVLTKPKRG
ncbi:MAG: YeeE/YedE family protein [Phycisphaerales bacterium]|nr:MAG: YeeE/YedE family protein [Phycisphaerales bacterium]